MRLLLTALTCPKGEVETNLARHLGLLEQGREAGCDLVLLPEMSLTGYRPAAAIPVDHPAVRALVAATAGAPDLCFGLAESGEAGGAPFITQLLARDGGIASVHRKAGVATDEEAHFRRGLGSRPVTLAGVSTSLAVCAEIGTDPPYAQALILGPAAPGLYGARRRTDEDWRRGYDWWRGSVTTDAARLLGPNSWLAVSTQAGATDDEDFPGWAALIGPGGRVVADLPDWREGQLVVEL